MTFVLKLLSSLPLLVLQGMGWLLGWVAFVFSAVYRKRFLENVALAGVPSGQWIQAVGEAGKLVAELPRLWLGRPVSFQWEGKQHIDQALTTGRGLVFLTPHMGCFEVAAQAYAADYGVAGHPMTVLFRPARQPWLARWVAASRARPGLETAPTTLAGVKQLLKALKAGHSVGLLPDQVPPLGQGAWTPFFGRDAYTMTLSARLALQTGAQVLLAWGQRKSWGRGYVVHVAPMAQALSGNVEEATLQINRAMELLIRQNPQQYLWGYARYKSPRASD
jgi:KDO2-lipid IV(A) lauroyltransferase